MRFLVGDDQAIRSVASARAATWLAFSWVLLAGLFREYDQEDLLRAPWVLFIPLVASTGLALLLYGVLLWTTNAGQVPREQRVSLRAFLTCFWLTAPLAAIYALPVEQWGNELEATRWNLWFLLIVSIWRVLLISRIVSVLYPVSFWQAFFPVMFLADSVVIIAMTQIRLPLLQIMGGIQLTDAERLINDVRVSLIFLGILTWPIWLLAAGFVNRASKRLSPLLHPHIIPQQGVVANTAWGGILVCLVVMCLATSQTQPLRQRASRYERLIRAGDYAAALASLAQFQEDELPPLWDPPPRILSEYSDSQPFYLALAALNDVDAPPWLQDRFGNKLLKLRGWGHYSMWFWSRRNDFELLAIARFLQRNPDWVQRFEEEQDYYKNSPREFLKGAMSALTDETESDEYRERQLHESVTLETLLELQTALGEVAAEMPEPVDQPSRMGEAD